MVGHHFAENYVFVEVKKFVFGLILCEISDVKAFKAVMVNGEKAKTLEMGDFVLDVLQQQEKFVGTNTGLIS